METQKKEKEIYDLKGRYDAFRRRMLMVVRVCFRLRGVLPVVCHWIYPRSISCVNIRFINGTCHKKWEITVDVFLILMIRNVHNVPKKMPRSEI
jgi:hypothetical protein